MFNQSAITQLIQAEDFIDTLGVGIFEGGQKIGGTQNGDWVKYDTPLIH